MDDDDAHDIVKVVLDARHVVAGRLVGTLDGIRRPVGPVHIVLVLRQAERVFQVRADDANVTTWGTRGEEEDTAVICIETPSASLHLRHLNPNPRAIWLFCQNYYCNLFHVDIVSAFLLLEVIKKSFQLFQSHKAYRGMSVKYGFYHLIKF